MNLNIKKFPDDVAAKYKAIAALKQVNECDYIIEAVKEKNEREQASMNITLPTTATR